MLIPDIPCLCKILKKPTDLDLHCLPLSMWIYSNNPDQIMIGWKLCWRGILIYSAGQRLTVYNPFKSTLKALALIRLGKLIRFHSLYMLKDSFLFGTTQLTCTRQTGPGRVNCRERQNKTVEHLSSKKASLAINTEPTQPVDPKTPADWCGIMPDATKIHFFAWYGT